MAEELDITIGLTGEIGSGKSVVARILRNNGIVVYDTDSEARRIMETDSEVINSLKETLGEEIYLPTGKINRPYLAKLIFSDDKMRAKVNGIVHKAVREDIKKERSKLKGFFFIESAILATGGITDFCDEIWIVNAPEDQRIERVIRRDNLSLKEIMDRIKSQKKELELLHDYPCYDIDNSINHPILLQILTKIRKNQNLLTQTIPC